MSADAFESTEVLDLLTALVEKSLVVYEENDHGQGRYHFLETVRQYAGDRLVEREDVAALRDRHRDWFLEQTERLHSHAWEEQEPYFTFVGREYDNVRRSLDWSRSSDGRGEAVLRLAGCLWLYWFHSGALVEAQARLKAALVGAPSAPSPARAMALLGLGMVSFSDDPMGEQSLEESVVLFRQLGDSERCLTALCPLAFRYARRGEFEKARALLDQVIAQGQDLGDQYLAYATFHKALCAREANDHFEAEQLLMQVISDPRTWGSVRHFALSALGEARLELGKSALARQNFVAALGQARPMHGTITLLRCLSGLARAWLAEGDAVRAARLFGATEGQLDRAGVGRLPMDRAPVERAIAAARTALGEADYLTAWTEGRTVPIEQLLAAESAAETESTPGVETS